MPAHFQIIMAFDKQHYEEYTCNILYINCLKKEYTAFITKLGQETSPMDTKYIHEDKLPEQHKRHLLALIPYIYG